MRWKKPGPAELKPSTSLQVAENSHENFGITALTHCLVDADGNTTAGAGRARRKALGVSALVQFCTLTAILIVPLFATGTRLILRPTNFVPLPPYGGAPRQRPEQHGPQRPSTIHHATIIPIFRDPAPAPTRPERNAETANDLDREPDPNPSSRPGIFPGGDGSSGNNNLFPGIPGLAGPQPPRPEATPTSASRKPISVSQGVQLALLTHRVEPIYPNFAKQTHREGIVELRATISSDGAVKDVQVISGDPVLAQSARDAVTQWRFRPTLLNGVAVEVITFITVKFHIGE